VHNPGSILPLCRRSVAQAREPFDGGGNLAAVGKDEMQGSIVDPHINCMWIKPDCQSAHATSPRKTCGVRSSMREPVSIRDF